MPTEAIWCFVIRVLGAQVPPLARKVDARSWIYGPNQSRMSILEGLTVRIPARLTVGMPVRPFQLCELMPRQLKTHAAQQKTKQLRTLRKGVQTQGMEAGNKG